MRKSRKIVVALISFAGILFCLLIVLLVALPQLINLETVKQEVKHLYASDTGGHIEYQHLNMAFFPRPHVVISDVSFTIPDNIQGTVDSVKIYPKMLPLLTGDLQISVVHTRSPEITIQVPETSKDEKTVRRPFLLETPGNWLKSVLEAIPALKIPSMAINARNGQIHFYRGQRRFWGLQGLSGQVKHKGRTIEFSAQCQSNFWENLTIKGRYAEAGFKLDSQMKLNQFRPHAVAEYLFPESGLKMTNARANLTVDLKTEGTHFLQADIQGALPYMYWRRANKELKLDDTRLQARILFDGGDLSLNLLQLDLTDPRLSLAGRLNINPGQPTIQLEIEGRQINVSTAQRMALALTEKADTVSNIFNILNEGDFQRITLNTQASDWAQLADKEKLVLRGKLVGGKLSIPVGSLELENVRGDATFANGILTGENVEAQMGNSFAKKGKLSIALTGATAPFRIEGLIQADLSELPAVLANLITNQRFQKELKLFNKFEGSALGLLVIGEDLRDIKVKVMASDLTVKSVYQRIPYPVSVKGGSFVLDSAQIALTNCDVRIGNSNLAGLSTRFGWQQSSFLEASSSSVYIDLAQLHAWLTQIQTFENNLKNIQKIDGAVSLQNLTLNGPLFKPAQWQLKSKGVIQNIVLTSALLPGPLTIAQGRFSCESNRLKVKKLNAQVGQSIFTGLNANLKWGKETSLTANAGASMLNLDEIYTWLKSNQRLKRHVNDVPALNGTLAFSNLAFEGPIGGRSNQKINLNGAIDKWHIRSAEFPTDIELTGGDILWRRSRIDLQETNARFGTSTVQQLSLVKQWGKISLLELSAAAANIQLGELYPWLVSFQTLDKMFKGYKVTQGKLTLTDLDFKGPLGVSKAWQFQLVGDVMGMDLESDFFKEPIRIKTANFAAKDTPAEAGVSGRIDLKAAQIEWENSRILLRGDATFSEDQLSLDMQLVADQLNWGQIEQIASVEMSTAPAEKMELRGGLKVELDSFTYNSFAWRPVHADISFAKTDTRIVIRKADICGIQFPGILKISGEAFELYFNPEATGQDLNESITCLFDKQHLMAGSFVLDGELLAKARPSEFTKSLTGNLHFDAAEGRIYRFGMLAKIFALLNVTEIYRGEVPDLKGKGFAYNSITANGVFEDGKLIIQDTSIDSPSMGIAIEGDIDLIKKRVNLVVLVAPFKTVDRIVKIIPLVGNILGGNLISIPFRAIGDLGDPDVIPLSPTAVGSGLLGILERTLKLPITIIQPVIPGSKKAPVKGEKKPPSPSP